MRRWEDAILMLEKEHQGGFARWVLASKYDCNWWPYSLLKGFDVPYILTKGLK